MTAPSYEEARLALEARLGASALAHSDAVAREAASLAVSYGVDPASARMAGLLHDWCKESDDTGLIAAAERHGIALTEVDRARPYLLHARVGAAELSAAFPELPRDVVRAVGVHTLGDAQMSDLDCVVYIADMIEPRRAYAGVEELRSAAGSASLRELMLLACGRTLVHVIESRRPVHPDSVATWNALLAKNTAGGRP